MSDDLFDVEFEDMDADVEETEVVENEDVKETEAVENEGVKETEVVENEDADFENESEGNQMAENNQEVMVNEDSKTEVMDNSNPINDIQMNVNSPGVKKGKMGDTVSRYPIEKIRFTTSKNELVSIITNNVIIAKTHYHEDTGKFFCFDGECCEILDLPRVRYVFPVVKYDTNKKGKPVSTDVEIMALDVSQEYYDDLMTIEEMNGGDITNLDLLINCKDETYQRISFTTAGKARWRKSNEVKSKVVKIWKEKNKYLLKAIARKITPKKFKEAMDMDDVNEPGVGNDMEFNDVFN